jgi:Uma2 family endonuclease
MIANSVLAPEATPTRRHATYEEYLATASETRVVEWVDGEIIEYVPPLVEHQDLTGFLYQLVSAFVTKFDMGKVGISPTEVKLWPGGPSREPDVFVVLQASLSGFDRWRYNGGPDLVVEVVSPGSVREDRVRKFTEYEQAGVREYWLVDPRPRQRTVECFRRDAAGVYQPVEVGEDGRLYSQVLHRDRSQFWLHVDWLWQDPLPKVQTCLQQILAGDESAAASE